MPQPEFPAVLLHSTDGMGRELTDPVDMEHMENGIPCSEELDLHGADRPSRHERKELLG